MARPSPSCAHDDDRLRLPPASPSRSNSAEKKESTVRRLSQLCPPCATPSSNSSLDYRRSDARIVKNGFAASSGVSKSAKVVLGRVLINAQIAVPLSESCSQINQDCAGCRAARAGTTTENAIGCAAKRRTKDRRTAHGNGTAFSAVAPSKRPVFAAHRSNIREWYCPQARIAGHLTFHLLVRFRAHCGFLSG